MKLIRATVALAPAVALALMTTPALAHPGAHFNPHGGESVLALIFGLLAIAAAGLLARSGPRK